MPITPTDFDIRSYYQASLAALRHLEALRPTGRRFGAEADARWSTFRGHLNTRDRIDLLIRDANAQWPESLGARAVFSFDAVAEDDPFGPDFPRIDATDAEDLWRASLAKPAPARVEDVVASIGAAWNIAVAPFDPSPIAATDRLLVVGFSAIAAALEVFARGRDLDWNDQVLVVASSPAARQLGAVAAALLGASAPTSFLDPQHPRPTGPRRLVASPDAAPDELRRAQEALR